jgi:hypothetical protein
MLTEFFKVIDNRPSALFQSGAEPLWSTFSLPVDRSAVRQTCIEALNAPSDKRAAVADVSIDTPDQCAWSRRRAPDDQNGHSPQSPRPSGPERGVDHSCETGRWMAGWRGSLAICAMDLARVGQVAGDLRCQTSFSVRRVSTTCGRGVCHNQSTRSQKP